MSLILEKNIYHDTIPSELSAEAFIDLFPTIQGEHHCEVLIIGGGFTGISAAYELSKSGIEVSLIEEEIIGFGASGRNGGHLCTDLTREHNYVSKLMGYDKAKEMFDFSEIGKQLIKDRVAEHNIDCDLKWGYADLAFSQRHADGIDHDIEMFQEKLNYPLRRLSKQEVVDNVGTERYSTGIYDGGAGHFHPLKYLRHLAKVTTQQGANIYQKSKAISIDTETKFNGSTKVTTAHATIFAKQIIMAGNGYMGKLVPYIHKRRLAVPSFQVATAPLDEKLNNEILKSQWACSDMRFVTDYFRMVDNQLIYGTGCSYTGSLPSDIRKFVRSEMYKTFPQLKDYPLSHAWSGNIAITMTRMISAGRINDNILYSQGYSGHGIVLSNLMGKLMADAIKGEGRGLDLFAEIQHMPFPGGFARRWLVASAVLFYRMRDILAI